MQGEKSKQTNKLFMSIDTPYLLALHAGLEPALAWAHVTSPAKSVPNFV